MIRSTNISNLVGLSLYLFVASATGEDLTLQLGRLRSLAVVTVDANVGKFYYLPAQAYYVGPDGSKAAPSVAKIGADLSMLTGRVSWREDTREVKRAEELLSAAIKRPMTGVKQKIEEFTAAISIGGIPIWTRGATKGEPERLVVQAALKQSQEASLNVAEALVVFRWAAPVIPVAARATIDWGAIHARLDTSLSARTFGDARLDQFVITECSDSGGGVKIEFTNPEQGPEAIKLCEAILRERLTKEMLELEAAEDEPPDVAPNPPADADQKQEPRPRFAVNYKVKTIADAKFKMETIDLKGVRSLIRSTPLSSRIAKDN